MRLPKHTALNQMDWPKDSTSSSWIRFAACLSMQWPYAAHYAVLIYNNLPHSALDNHKSPSNPYGDSFDFLRLYVFGSIFYALQPSKLLDMLEERSAKELFLGIDPAGYKVLDLQSKVAYVARTVKVFDGKFLSTEKIKFTAFAEKRKQHTQVLCTLRLQDLRILATHLKVPEKEDVLHADLTHAFNFKS